MHGLRLRLVTAGNYSHGLFLSAHEYIRSYGTLTILVPTPSVNRVDLIWRLGYCQYPSVPVLLNVQYKEEYTLESVLCRGVSSGVFSSETSIDTSPSVT